MILIYYNKIYIGEISKMSHEHPNQGIFLRKNMVKKHQKSELPSIENSDAQQLS
jgi:hypothetical protein